MRQVTIGHLVKGASAVHVDDFLISATFVMKTTITIIIINILLLLLLS